MKHIQLFEEFISNVSITANENSTTPKDSKVSVDDFMTDSGLEIKSTEIVGAIVSNETEKEFKDYFYDTYGINAFTDADISSLETYFNEYLEEVTAKETEEEEAEKEEGEEDPLADI